MKSAPIKSSTQEHLEISDIRDDVVILKDNSATIIIQTAAINFELLSVDEQDSIIYSYAGLLNSLNFTIQIVVRSKKIDLSNYLQLISQAETHQANPDIKRQIFQYRQFIQTVVQQNNVLEKKFYVVIPFNPLELGVKGAALGNIQKDNTHTQGFIDLVKTSLYPKRDHLVQQFGRIGIKSKQLTTQELIELYFDIYNPSEVGLQKIIESAGSYTSPIVSPAVSAPIVEENQVTASIASPAQPQPQQIETLPAQPQPLYTPQPPPAPPAGPQQTIYAPNPAVQVPTVTISPPDQAVPNVVTPQTSPIPELNPQIPTIPPVINTPQPQPITMAPQPNSSENLTNSNTIDPDILKALNALKSPSENGGQS